MGELRPGSSGWMHQNSEALALFTFRKAEQQYATHPRIRRPPPLFFKPLHLQNYPIQIL